jgi:uncharacterized membrane protein YphA (DoxX/SURF4 family)
MTPYGILSLLITWGIRVANKGRIRRNIKRLQRVQTWQLVLLLVLALFLAATFLRLNNIGMAERRAAVLSSDDAGNNDTTITQLYDLQRYVSTHMNTDMGKGLYLLASYKKAVHAAYDKASSDNNPNGNIYKKVQDVCAPRFTRWSIAYVQCTSSELAKYPAATNLINAVQLPRAGTYLHVFVSPLWSPDFAGWTVLVCIALVLMIVTRLVSVMILRMMLRHHYKSA